MVVDNAYNRDVKNKLKTIAYQKAEYLRKLADNPAEVVVHNQQDFINVKHPELEGGSGNLASTSFDLGIEPKMVGGVKVVKHRKSRTKKLIDAVENTQPITEKALMASGITAAGKPRKVRVKKIKGGDLNDVMRVAGDVVSSGAKIAAHAAPLLLGLGKKPTEWNTLVAKVRKEKGLSLKETLKYIKDNRMYEKKTKGKSGGSARLPLMDESVAANLRDVMPPTTQEVGNVKSLKHDGSHEMVVQPSSSSGYTTKRRGRPRL